MTEEIIQQTNLPIIHFSEDDSSFLRPPLPPQNQNKNKNQNQEYIFTPGNFEYIEIPSTRDMLINGYQSVSLLELWDYMKKKQESFMWSSDKEIFMISDKMTELGYHLHSGFSFGWTMRQIQYIAIHGEQNYIKLIDSNKNK